MSQVLGSVVRGLARAVARRRLLAVVLAVATLAAVAVVLPETRPAEAAPVLPPACTTYSSNCVQTAAMGSIIGSPPSVTWLDPAYQVRSAADLRDCSANGIGYYCLDLRVTTSPPECPDAFDPFGSPPCNFQPGVSLRYYDPGRPATENAFPVGNSGPFSLRSTTCSAGTCTYVVRVEGRVFAPTDPGAVLIAEVVRDAAYPMAGGYGVNSTRQDLVVSFGAGGDDTPPAASFTATPDLTAPGSVVFRSTSTDTAGLPLLETWDFGDGETGTGPLAVHTYDEPGDYEVTLTVRNTLGAESTTTQTVVVAAPTLSAVVELLDGAAPPLEVDADVRVRVTLSAGTDGIGELSGLQFTDGAVLLASPADAFTLVGGPTPTAPTAPFRLQPGEQRSHVLTLHTERRGTYDLSTHVTGVDAAGRDVSVDADAPGRIGSPDGMTVALVAPESIDLDRDADNELVPKAAELQVTVTNDGDSDLRAVTLRDGDPAQLPDAGVASLPFRALTPDPAPVRSVPTLAPGESVTFTLPYQAVAGGGVEWLVRVDALAGEGDEERELLGTAGGRSRVITDGLAEVTLDPQSTPVRAGDVWTVYGRIHNISNDATLRLDALRPTLFGNAAGGWAVDLTTPPAIGASIPPEIGAGETWSFKADIHTAVDMNAVSAVEFALTGTVVRDGQDEADLDPAEIVFEGPKRVQALVETPTFDPTEQTTFESAFGNFEYSLGTTIWEGLVGLKELPSLLANGARSAMATQGTIDRIDFLVTHYEALPVEARDEWIDSAYGALQAEYGAQSQVLEGVKGQMRQWFSDLRFAVDSGDVNQLARIGGSTTANLFDTEIIGVFTKVIQPKWARFLVTKTAEFEDAAKAGAVTDSGVALARMEAAATPAAAELAADDLRKALTSGTPVTPASAKLWGVAPETYDFLAQLARQRGYLITLRARSIGALEKLRAGFLPKMELIKLKNVDPIDVDYLGYLADDMNTVVLKKPPVTDVAQVDAWVAANVGDAAARPGVAARLETRVKEWAKVEARKPGFEYLTYAENEFMPVPFNVAENLALPFGQAWNKKVVEVLKGLQNRVAGKAKFELEAVAGHPEYFRLKVNGRGITGDIDFMDFRKANGEPLTLTERLLLYRELARGTGADIVGMQHPETISWFLDSKQWFDAKKAYIEEFSGPRSDTLLQFSPEAQGSARAVRYDPARSKLVVDTGENIWRYEGGFTTAKRFRIGASDLTFIGNISAQIQQFAEQIWGPPSTWLVDPGQPGTGQRSTPQAPDPVLTGIATPSFADDADGRVPVTYVLSVGPGAVVARAGWDHLELWTAEDGWQPASPGDGAPLELMPQTAVSEGVAAGATRLEIVEPSAATVGTTAPAAWFEPGQRVVLDPGGPNEELATVAAVGSLVLDRPLANPHLAGEVVSVVEAAPTTPTTTPTPTTVPPTTVPPTTAPPTTTPVTTGLGGPEVAGAGAEGAELAATPVDGGSGSLPYTGGDTSLVLWAVALLGGGVLLARLGRLRRR